MIKYDKINGKLLHLNQLIATSGYHWDVFEQYKKLPLDERPCHARWGDGSELSYNEEKVIIET